jgi:hypothetical protein
MMIPFGIIIFLFYMLSIIRKLNLFKKKSRYFKINQSLMNGFFNHKLGNSSSFSTTGKTKLCLD